VYLAQNRNKERKIKLHSSGNFRFIKLCRDITMEQLDIRSIYNYNTNGKDKTKVIGTVSNPIN
jgi:hypothetical protein